MRIATEVTQETVWAAVWLSGSSGEDFPRHDSVRARINRTTGRAAIRSLIDVGLPVLQLRSAEFRPAQGDRETIAGLLNDGKSAAALGEAFVLSILARAADVTLTDKDDADAADSDFGSELLDIDAFMNVGSPTGAGFAEPRQNPLQLTRDTVSAGISANILARDGDLIHPAPDFLLRAEADESALLGAEIMLTDQTRRGIDLPDGFGAVSLTAAAEALSAVAAPKAAAVHYFGDTTSPHHRHRMQAASAYPLLAEALAIDSVLQRRIDGAEPLGPALSERTGLGRGHLKRLKNLQSPLPDDRLFEFGEAARGTDPMGIDRARRYSIGGDLSLEQVFSLFRGFPANWMPDNDTAWTSFIDVVSACALPINSGFGVPLRTVLAAAKGDWAGYKSSLARAYCLREDEFDRRQMALATADTLEMVDDFSRSVIFPLLLCTIDQAGNPIPAPAPDLFIRGRAIAFGIIAGNAKNIPGSLLSAARNWTARIPALMEAEAVDEPDEAGGGEAYSDGRSWPALTGSFTSSNGLIVQNLVTEEQLKEESKRLNHCVGRLYVRKARNGNCHIFSVRSSDLSESHSTIELSPVEDGPDRHALADLEIRQHKAKNNRRPNKKAFAASQEWLAALRSGSLHADTETVRIWRKRQREAQYLDNRATANSKAAIQIQWSAALGRNWHAAQVRDAVWEEWKSHILGGELARARGLGFLYTKPGVRGLLTALCPCAARTMSDQRSRQSAD